LDGTGTAMRRYAEDQYWKSIPLPSQRPFDRYQSPTALDASTTSALQSLQVQGNVTGTAEIKQTVTVEPSSWFVVKFEKLENAVVGLSGRFNTNGPGSAGTSSPDTAAPGRPSAGITGSW
ncbi:MAG: hypothetical protein P4L99_05460, partial [Chthoniobacter sp.]|nr:hypothetical protein [Chthoniobacter sp.]